MSEEVEIAPVRRAYALVGEVISTSTEIEIELLYISLLLAENASSVNQLWHRVSGFRQRIDLTDVVVELTNAHTKTRQFWIAFRRALLELNSLRNHIAHGALLNDGEGDEEVDQIHIMKIYEDNSAKLVSLDDMERLRDLMRDALEEARWFNK
ncbi:MAG: hypothetical protein KTR21_11075, partial [Rhodobacteraceae bacterium]|nr:hypothetical protein [Paracoccaceae bacterium]